MYSIIRQRQNPQISLVIKRGRMQVHNAVMVQMEMRQQRQITEIILTDIHQIVVRQIEHFQRVGQVKEGPVPDRAQLGMQNVQLLQSEVLKHGRIEGLDPIGLAARRRNIQDLRVLVHALGVEFPVYH